ncbi:MAG: hypothetical protein EPO07_02430 [Verrucomicrobia bacterium]|nr:MAG: hypothetical protein EPO07_02430 [Verrucomicrobiota bacterium]
MEIRARRFNIYFGLAVLTLAALLGGGCASPEKKKQEQLAALRVHLEVAPDSSGLCAPVPICRTDPVMVNVLKEPFLFENDVAAARVLPDPDGTFIIGLQLTQHGTWVLENYTASNPGKRFAIFADWGVEGQNHRWLAAPKFKARITDGRLSFSPDLSHEEADELVLGLNNLAIKEGNQEKPKKQKK